MNFKNPKTYYSEIYNKFLFEYVEKLTFDELIIELKDSDSAFNFLLKDDCIDTFLKTGFFIKNGITTDDLYTLAIYKLSKQLEKSCFFLDDTVTTSIIKKIKARIVNNMKNFYDKQRIHNYESFLSTIYIEQNYIDFKCNELVENMVDFEIRKHDFETIKRSLKIVYLDSIYDSSFDLIDFQYLINKYLQINIQPKEILGFNPVEVPKIKFEAVNNSNYSQSVLLFETDESEVI